MLTKKRLGIVIKNRRKAINLTQKQLAHGICDQSEISRIEAGDFFPSIDVLYPIASKLKFPISYLFEVLTYEDTIEIKSIKEKITNLSLTKNYLELHIYLDKLLKENKNLHPEIEKFLQWKNLVSKYCLKKIDANYCMTELLLLLRRKDRGMDVLIDLQIKNSIANILAENSRYKKSMKIYKEILEEETQTTEAEKIKTKVLYNYGKLLYLEQQYEEALVQANRGIALSINLADMSLLGQFFYEKASIMEELSFAKTQISPFYEKALFFFELLQLDMHTQILKEKKREYLK